MPGLLQVAFSCYYMHGETGDRVMRVALAVGCLAQVFVMGLLLGMWGTERLDPRLFYRDAIGYDRITGVAEELVARSPEMQDSWKSFQACSAPYACVTTMTSIARMREHVIAANWSMVFDHLVQRAHWGTSFTAQANRAVFFSAYQRLGADRMRNHCVPLIAYYLLPSRGGYYHLYYLAGYRCGAATYTSDGRPLEV
jgi:hypothetical protein